MAIVPAPEPWQRGKSFYGRQLERMNRRVGVYDAKGKLVGWMIVREAEKMPKLGRGIKNEAEREGAMLRADRIITCVNAFQYVPSEMIEQNGIVQFATELMRKACHLGDLQLDHLPDIIADNMQRIFDAQFKYPKGIPDDATATPMREGQRQSVTGIGRQTAEGHAGLLREEGEEG